MNKGMTKYEWICSMSIDEMASWIDKFDCLNDEICEVFESCPYMDDSGDVSDDCDCTGCIKKWLLAELDGEQAAGEGLCGKEVMK